MIGEEWGFIGAVLLVALFVVLLLRCLYVARFAKDNFGSYIVIGLMSMFLFISLKCRNEHSYAAGYGHTSSIHQLWGTSVIVNYIAIGIIISISMRRQRPMFEV